MIVQDGACTHISPKAWVPFFVGLMAPRTYTCLTISFLLANGRLTCTSLRAVLIGQIAWTYMTLTYKKYSGSFTAYSEIVGAIPIISFAGLTLHVLTNAPPLRRFLIRISTGSRGAYTLGYDRAVIFINASLFIWCAFAAGILVLPAKTAYEQGDTAGKVYAAAMDILAKAKPTQDIAALVNLTPIMAQFGELMTQLLVGRLPGQKIQSYDLVSMYRVHGSNSASCE
jgi:hypothetical protein